LPVFTSRIRPAWMTTWRNSDTAGDCVSTPVEKIAGRRQPTTDFQGLGMGLLVTEYWRARIPK
jgi:hypothetical protein